MPSPDPSGPGWLAEPPAPPAARRPAWRVAVATGALSAASRRASRGPAPRPRRAVSSGCALATALLLRNPVRGWWRPAPRLRRVLPRAVAPRCAAAPSRPGRSARTRRSARTCAPEPGVARAGRGRRSRPARRLAARAPRRRDARPCGPATSLGPWPRARARLPRGSGRLARRGAGARCGLDLSARRGASRPGQRRQRRGCRSVPAGWPGRAASAAGARTVAAPGSGSRRSAGYPASRSSLAGWQPQRWRVARRCRPR